MMQEIIRSRSYRSSSEVNGPLQNMALKHKRCQWKLEIRNFLFDEETDIMLISETHFTHKLVGIDSMTVSVRKEMLMVISEYLSDRALSSRTLLQRLLTSKVNPITEVYQ